jgi:hypothetical protein
MYFYGSLQRLMRYNNERKTPIETIKETIQIFNRK